MFCVPGIFAVGDVGVIAIDTKLAAATVKVSAPLVIPLSDAVIPVVPADTPVAKPPLAVIVATPVLEEAQVTLEVISAAELSE